MSLLAFAAGSYTSDGYSTYYWCASYGWRNNVPVTPGEVLRVIILAAQNSIVNAYTEVRRAATGEILIRISHIQSNVVADKYMPTRGGNMPLYGFLGDERGAPYSYSYGISPFGHGPNSSPATGVGSAFEDPSIAFGSWDNPGCVRMIWGAGRSFPFNARRLSAPLQ